FGKISLDPKEKDRSKFREHVFPETPNLNGQLLLDLVKNDVAFNNLDDDDAIHVTTPIPATRGSSSSRSVHTCVRKEVHRENGNGSVSVQVGGLDHQSTEKANHCIYSENLDKNHLVDGLDHQSVEGVNQVTSVNKVTKLINELFTSPNDLGFSQANFVFGYVDVDNMDKDGYITNVKTVARPFRRQRRLGKACDLNDLWERLVGRSSSKRGWVADDHIDIWIEYLWHFRQPNDDWAMASPYLSDMLSRYELPLYYAHGNKYGVPWFASGVEKVYFPINE
nr:ulp1 protease family, C-terminal catalytic domain-containing protein [Tanacetum cinerariifolium]